MSKHQVIAPGADIVAKVKEYKALSQGIRFANESGNAATFPSQYVDKSSMALTAKATGYEEMRVRFPGLPAAPTVSIPFTDEDLKHYEDKIKIAETAIFDEWFAMHYMDAGVAEREKMRQLYPAYFENKLKVNRDAHQYQEDLARISIKGPETFEDLVKVYATQLGGADPEVNLTRQTAGAAAGNVPDYKAGLWAGDSFKAGMLGLRGDMIAGPVGTGAVLNARADRYGLARGTTGNWGVEAPTTIYGATITAPVIGTPGTPGTAATALPARKTIL